MLASLVDKSLLGREGADGEPRFGMLETVREYALERLGEAGETELLHRRHLRWAVSLAERTGCEIYGPDAVTWMDALTAELANVRTALAWSLADQSPESARDGLRLAAALHPFWYIRDHLSEGRQWLEQILATHGRPLPDPGNAATWVQDVSPDLLPLTTLTDDPTRRHQWGRAPLVVALNAMASLSATQQHLDVAEPFAHAALALADRLGDAIGYAYALGILGMIARAGGELDRATALYEDGLVRMRRAKDPAGIWNALTHIGEVTGVRGDLVSSERFHAESLAVARILGCSWQIAASLNRLGRVAYWRREHDRAIELLEESIAWYRPMRATRGPHRAFATLAAIALERGDSALAALRYLESLETSHQAGERGAITACLEGLASVWAATSRNGVPAAARRAAHLFGLAERMREASGVRRDPDLEDGYGRSVATARAHLGDAAFVAAWAEGRKLSVRETLAEILGDRSPERLRLAGSGRRSIGDRADLLTAREREVATLIGRGDSNRQIAERLVTSERTVETHARNIREKLGLTTRAELIAWVADNGPLPEPD